MQTTKSRILDHLKRSGGSPVDELAASLGLARMTIRQHLAALERDDLVTSYEARRPTGRPRFVYKLTDRGEETFPKRYDLLAEMILAEVVTLDGRELDGLAPEEKKKLLFDRMVRRLSARYASRMDGKTLRERVITVAEILEEEGGLAEWRSTGGGFEIADYNCVYRSVAGSHHELCDWHLSLLSQLLGSDVRSSQLASEGAECCRFVVEVAGPNRDAAKRRERKVG